MVGGEMGWLGGTGGVRVVWWWGGLTRVCVGVSGGAWHAEWERWGWVGVGWGVGNTLG